MKSLAVSYQQSAITSTIKSKVDELYEFLLIITRSIGRWSLRLRRLFPSHRKSDPRCCPTESDHGEL